MGIHKTAESISTCANCLYFDDTSCNAASGCSWDASGGGASQCYGSDESSCKFGTPTCTWTASTSTCSGTYTSGTCDDGGDCGQAVGNTVAQYFGGWALIVLGVIFTSVFACGIGPCCCFAKEGPAGAVQGTMA